MKWLQENILNLILICLSAISIYIALNDRVTILEQKAYAAHEEGTQVLKLIDEVKSELKEFRVEVRTDNQSMETKLDAMRRELSQDR